MNKEPKNALIIAALTASFSIMGTMTGIFASHFLAAENARVQSARQNYKDKLELRRDLLRKMLAITSMKGHVSKLHENIAAYAELVSRLSTLVKGDQDEFDKLIAYDEILNKKTKEFTELYGRYASTVILCKISFGPETKKAAIEVMNDSMWWKQNEGIRLLISSMEKEFYYNQDR